MDLAKQKEIGKHFDKLYQAGQKPWTHHPFEPLIDEFLKLLSEKFRNGAKVLDTGCGNGWISIKAAKAGSEVWGIDSSPTAIAEAKKSAKKEGVDNLTHFTVGDALNLPFEKDFFGALVDRGLFHHILPENRQTYLKNILFVLGAGSLFYLSVFSMKNSEGIGQRFTKGDIEEIFGKDFEILKFSEDEISSDLPAHLLHFIFSRKE